jgi:uncharacterized membrane protein YdjX (TVP38/TMEM64 family)
MQSLHADENANVFRRAVASSQQMMMNFIQRHGFIGILLLASYPNAAFDLCGICCGAFMMPFWQFFGATLIGKAFVKVNGQTAFFVALFRWAACCAVCCAACWSACCPQCDCSGCDAL